MTTEIRQGVVKAWNAVNYVADIQLTGSLSQWLHALPVSRGLPGADMVVGRRVAVAFFDPTNPTDAVVFAVYT